MLPTLKSVNELQTSEKREQLRKWCQENPLDDHVYYFEHTVYEFNPSLINSTRNAVWRGDWIIAGSAALHKVVTYVMIAINDRKVQKLEEPNDTDVFLLASTGPHRAQIGKADIVHATEKTVDELLLNFDLPCCRAATNSHFDYWISAQCLNSIITGTYYIPRYCFNLGAFTEKLKKHRDCSMLRNGEPTLFGRLQDRINKYQKRGFNPVWIDTEKVLPWIKQRFHYCEWLQVQEPLEVKNMIITNRSETEFTADCVIDNLPVKAIVSSNIRLDAAMVDSLVRNRILQSEQDIRAALNKPREAGYFMLTPIKITCN